MTPTFARVSMPPLTGANPMSEPLQGVAASQDAAMALGAHHNVVGDHGPGMVVRSE